MLLFVLCVLGFAEPVYVQASLLNLRQAPDPDAAIEAWVRIGTALEIDAEHGDWVHVSLSDRPVEHPVTGWVLGRFLDVHRPTRDSLATLDPQERRDRLAALTGHVDDIVERTHLAVCDGRRVDYLGYFDAAGDFIERTEWDAPEQELMDLSAQHWTAIEPDGRARAIQGSPFVRPFGTERWNERDPSAFAPGTCEGVCEGPRHVVLGPCDRAGTAYTSRRASGVAPDPVRKEIRESMRERAEGLQPDLSLRDGFSEGVSSHAWILSGWAYEARVPLGATDGPATPMRTFLDLPGIGLVGVAAQRRETVRGWVLVLLDQDGFETRSLYVEGWGC